MYEFMYIRVAKFEPKFVCIVVLRYNNNSIMTIKSSRNREICVRNRKSVSKSGDFEISYAKTGRCGPLDKLATLYMYLLYESSNNNILLSVNNLGYKN